MGSNPHRHARPPDLAGDTDGNAKLWFHVDGKAGAGVYGAEAERRLVKIGQRPSGREPCPLSRLLSLPRLIKSNQRRSSRGYLLPTYPVPEGKCIDS